MESHVSVTERLQRVSAALTLFYLLLPNLLFLAGWVRPWAAGAAAALLLLGYVLIVRALFRKETAVGMRPFSVKDIGLWLVCMVCVFLLTEFIGFHGHVMQSADFLVRNPIYHTLVTQDWPLFSARGEYFIYYHAFWLPPAWAAKVMGTAVSADTLLFGWTFTGLALACTLLFFRLRGRTLLFLCVLCLLGCITEDLNPIHDFLASHGQAPALVHALNQLGCGSQVRYFHLWGQVVYTFNHAVPMLAVMALLLCGGLPLRYALYAAALVAACTPLGAVALLPLLAAMFLTHRREILRSINVPVLSACVLLACLAPYFIGTAGQEGGTSVCWLWGDSPYLNYEGRAFHLLHVRFLRYGLLLVTLFLPMLLLGCRLLKTRTAAVIAVLGVLLPIIWVGRINNELLYKGSLVLYTLLAYLYSIRLRHCGNLCRVVLVLFLLLSALHLPSDALRRDFLHYSWNPSVMKAHRYDPWEGSLDQPQDYNYANFFGTNKAPALLYDQAGDAMRQGPLIPFAAKHNEP